MSVQCTLHTGWHGHCVYLCILYLTPRNYFIVIMIIYSVSVCLLNMSSQTHCKRVWHVANDSMYAHLDLFDCNPYGSFEWSIYYYFFILSLCFACLLTCILCFVWVNNRDIWCDFTQTEFIYTHTCRERFGENFMFLFLKTKQIKTKQNQIRYLFTLTCLFVW